MSRARDTFETIVPNAQQKLNLIVEKSFCGIDAILPDVIDDHTTRRGDWEYCHGIGFPCSPPIDGDFPGFPLPGPPPQAPPDCPGRQRKIGGVCQDPGPTPPQLPDPPPPKPIVPPSPDPDPSDKCGLFEPLDSGCLSFTIDAVMTVEMLSTAVQANASGLGGLSDPMVDVMVTQCGGIPASATAACLFTLGEPKKFQIAVNVAASGDCAAQKTANENAVKKYIDLGGTVVNTHVISIVTSTKTGTQNANCLVDLIRPDFGTYQDPGDATVTLADGFYVSHDGALGHAGTPQKHRLSYGWIKGGTYFIDSLAFKTKATSNQYLTNLKLGRSIEGFHAVGEFRYTTTFPNYFLRSSRINTYNIDGQRIYYSGSPLSDSDSSDGYSVQGLGTTTSPLKVNWVPFSYARSLNPKIYSAVYSYAYGQDWYTRNKDIDRYDDRSAHLVPRFITLNQKGTLIVRIDDSVGPNKNVKVAETYNGTMTTGRWNYPLYVTSSPTKNHFVGEYKSVSFDLTTILPISTFGRKGYMFGHDAGDLMIFHKSFASPIAISGYEISVTPSVYAEGI